MKVVIEVWQSDFDREWKCNVTTTANSTNDETERWSVENFCDLLNLVTSKFPNAKCISLEVNDET